MQKKNRTSFRSSGRALALEPRLLFDGAGAVAAVDHFDTVGEHQAETQPQAAQPAADARPSEVAEKPAASLPLLDLAGDAANAASDYRLLLGDATSLAQQKLVEWVGSDAFSTQAAEIFSADAGSAEWNAQLDALRSDILNGSYSIRTEVRSNAEMQGLLGAFSASGGEPTLYLNAAYLDKANASQVAQVLIEEIGHAIDHQLNNGQDSTGDEGHAFAALLATGNADLAANQIRDDHHVLTLDGQSLAIESAGPYNIAQTHFVTMPEDQIWAGIQNVYSNSSDNKIESIIAITATSKDTHIVYDHWEDGYEADIKNPAGASTRIWWYNASGQWVDVKTNTVLADGATVGNVTAMGQTLILRNQVNKNSMGTVDFDGGDKIGSTKAISVTRAGWDTKIGTIVGGAVNLIDVGNAGTSYVIPVGTNTAEAPKIGSNSILQKDSLFIMAYENNTVVTVNLVKADGTSNGTISRTLQQGQSWYIGGLASGATVAGTGLADAKAVINEGTKVTADKKIGVNMLSGSSTSQNRWYGIAPTESWGNSYYAPVATVGGATSHIYLFNNNISDITVKYETLGAGGAVVENSVTVQAGKSKVVAMPASAGHFYSADGKAFYAVATVDPTTSRDWSYSLVAERTLTDRFVVAWGPGNGNTAGSDGKISGKNGSPVWVTAVGDTYLYIDSATTELKDAAGNTIAKDAGKSTGSVTAYKVDRLQSYRLRDTSDNNQSGLVVYTLDGTLITAAWGEDATVADTGSPYLDMGTTISPYPDYVLEKKAAEIVNNARENGVIEAGDEVKYTITLTNRAVIELLNIKITDKIEPASSAEFIDNSLTLSSFDEQGKLVWKIEYDTGESKFIKTYYQADGSTVDTSKGTAGKEEVSGFGESDLFSGGFTVENTLDRNVTKNGLQIGGFIQFTYKVTIKEDISKELADANFVVSNSVKLQADGVDKDKVNKVDLSGTITDGVVTFISGQNGSEVSSFEPGNDIWIRVTDMDQNKDKNTAEGTLTVTLTNATTGEKETVTLTETGVNTGVFEGKVSTVRGTGSAADNDSDGSIKLKRGDAIKVEYTDPNTGNPGGDANNGVDNPTNWGINSPNYQVGENNNVKTALVDDSGISVNDILVNEASPFGVFTVQGAQGQKVELALGTTGTGAGHATPGDDYTNSLEYFDFDTKTWKTYSSGNKVEITNPDGTLLVRNPIKNDPVFEGPETYELIVTPMKADGTTPGSATTGTATIFDDGTGTIWKDPTGPSPSDPTGKDDTAPKDHDRFPQVDNPVVNEDSGHVVFTVTTQPNDQITQLTFKDGTALGGTADGTTLDGMVDYENGSLEYSTDGSTWHSLTLTTDGSGGMTTGNLVTPISTGNDGTLFVRTKVENDTPYEHSETFTLAVDTITAGHAVGTATIKDDGTGTGGVDDDSGSPAITVDNPVVNEASGYVVFTVKNTDTDNAVDVKLGLANGTADGSSNVPPLTGESNKDFRNDTFEYWDSTTSTWVAYNPSSPADVAIAANGELKVRVQIYNDTVYEGAETFDLNVTPTGGGNAVKGTATILDDGTGAIWKNPNDPNEAPVTPDTTPDPNIPFNDDRKPYVSSPTVNEGSEYVVFEVTTVKNEVLSNLVFTDNTAKVGTVGGSTPKDGSVDYGSAMEYSTDNGSSWTAYTSGDVTVTSGTLLVRTKVANDDNYEVSENFNLTVTVKSDGKTATGVATILDDGTGDIFNSNGTKDTTATKDDDRPVSVNSPTVNEGSGYIVFEVGGIAGTPIDRLVLADGTAKGGTATDGTPGNVDYKNDSLQYFNGTAWVAWVDSADTPIPAGGTLLVRVAVFNDGLYENAETFTLKATTKGGIEATGTGTIKDDGTGDVWNPLDPDHPDTGNVTKNPGGFERDDDRTIAITHGGKFDLATKIFTESSIREDVQHTYFKVTDVAEGVQVKLEVANSSTELTLQPPMQFSIDGGTTWQNYSDGNKPVAPSSGEILVRVDISSENEDDPDDNETFTLTASYANNLAKNAEGTGTITDKLANAPKITPDDMNDDPAGYPTAEEKDGEVTVYEHGLRDSTGKQKATGTIQVEAKEGIKEIILGDDSFTLAQLGDGKGIVTTTLGTLKVTDVQVTEGPDSQPTKVTLTYTYTLNNPDDHTVAPGSNGISSTDEITIGVRDASTGENTADSKITVTIIDDEPEAIPDVKGIYRGAISVSDNALPNDRYVDKPGTVLGFKAGDDTSSAVTTGIDTELTGTYGKLTVHADGSYTYVLDNGNPVVAGLAAGQYRDDVFTYTMEDADGDRSTSTITIRVTGWTPNAVPLAIDDTYTLDENSPFTGSLQENDSPSTDGGNVWNLTSSPKHGQVTLNPDGTFTYVPDPDFIGEDSFTYTIVDKDYDKSTATVTLIVNPVNDKPVAVPDQVTTPKDTPVNGDLSGNDTPSPDGGNEWKVSEPPKHGKVTVTPEGKFTYVPDEGFTGEDSFTYTITDKDGDKSTAKVTVKVGENGQPVAVPDQVTTPKDTPVNGDLSGNDTPSPDGGNEWKVSEPPKHGKVTVTPEGKFTYVPDAGFTGEDSFTYTITDKDGDKSTSTVVITVAPNPPVNPPLQPVDPELPNFYDPNQVPVPQPVLPPDADQPLAPDQVGPSGPSRLLDSPVILDAGPYFANERFDDVRRLPLPFHPIVYVNREVSASQELRAQDDPRNFSDPSAAVPGEHPPVSLGAGLGMDINLFVTHAIRDSQRTASALSNSVEGRYSRLGLGSDGYLASPGLFSHSATEISELLKEQRKKLKKAAADVSGDALENEQGEAKPEEQTEQAKKPAKAAPQRLAGGAAPSFGEQLRSGAARLPLAPRKA